VGKTRRILKSGMRSLRELRILTWDKIVSIILVVVFLGMLMPLPVEGAGNTYYVAKNGSNSNAGTEALPWLTIQKAASTMVAGDTVYIKAGTYNERVIPAKSGSLGQYISYKAFGTDEVIIDGSGISLRASSTGYLDALFEINAKNYIWLEGVTIQNSQCYGVSMYSSCDRIMLKDLTITETQCSGIVSCYLYSDISRRTTNLVIDGCDLSYTNYDANQESISLLHVLNFEIKNCTVFNVQGNPGAAAPFDHQNAIDMKDGSSNGSVHDNYVYGDFCDGIYIDSGLSVADSISIYNNKVIGGYSGINLGSELSPYSAITNCNIYNNIVSSAYCFFASNYGASFTKNFTLINNTFYGTTASTVVVYLIDGTANYSNCVIRNNLIVATKSSIGLIWYSGYNDTTKTDGSGNVVIDHNLFYDAAGYNSSNKYGTNNIRANPLLVNPATDFSLAAGSPAIDAGIATDAPGEDYLGIVRPQGTSYDIGAYEYESGVINQSPILDLIGDQSINTAQLLTFTVSASDPEGDALIYSASNLPAGATFNASTMTFSWTPGSNQVGSYPGVRFEVSDGDLTDSEDILITVNEVQAYEDTDVNMDGMVNVLDFIQIGQHWDETGSAGWIREDVNKDGIINILDNILIGQHWTQ
jgi:hypothetical protein